MALGPGPQRRGASLAGTLKTLAAIDVALFAAVFSTAIIREPFSDMLAWLGAYLRFRQTGGLPGYLLAFHNEHRLLWIRLLTIVDAAAFRCSGGPFIVVATVALVAATALVVREVARGAEPAVLWLFPMLFLTAANAIDCSIPINGVYPLTLMFVIWSCCLFDGEAEAGRGTVVRRSTAIGLAAAAGFANAVGLLAWPVLLWVAWRGRAGLRWLALVGIIGAAYCLAYLHGVSVIIGSPQGMHAAPWTLQFGYLLAYLGLPLSRLASFPLPGRLLGLAVLALGIYAVIRVGLLNRDLTRLQRIATALILFSLGSAAMAAVGRSQVADGIDVPVRYAVLVAPLHAGLLALALPWAARHARAARACAVGLACVLLALQVIGGVAAVRAVDRMAATVARYYAGERDPQMAMVVYPDLPEADRIIATLRREGLFAD